MKRVGQATKNAFTIIEVSLYLALTGLIFVGIIASTRGNLARQRYVSSFNGIISHLQSIYEELERPSNENGAPKCVATYSMNHSALKTTRDTMRSIFADNNAGAAANRSGCVIYGEMINFVNTDDGTTIQHVPIVGLDINDVDQTVVESLSSKNIFNQLGNLAADTIVNEDAGQLYTTGASAGMFKSNATKFSLSANPQSYSVENQSSIELIVKDNASWRVRGREHFSILILQSPITGNITTDVLVGKLEKKNADGTTDSVNIPHIRDVDDFNEFNSSYPLPASGTTWWNDQFSFFKINQSGYKANIMGKWDQPENYTAYLCIYPGAGSDARPVRALRIDRNAYSSNAITTVDISDSKGICDQ